MTLKNILKMTCTGKRAYFFQLPSSYDFERYYSKHCSSCSSKLYLFLLQFVYSVFTFMLFFSSRWYAILKELLESEANQEVQVAVG